MRTRTRPRAATLATLALALLPCLSPWAAAAQIFSPGKLARPHASLEGITRCTACHGSGEETRAGKCLACHTPLARALDAGRGLHARGVTRAKTCSSCHPDHRGPDASLIRWEGPERFDHRTTGYRLKGAHAKTPCEGCHTLALVDAPVLRERLARGGERKIATYLGLSTRCARCHFDEHRGQLGEACERCHDTQRFVPAKGFDHRKRFVLEGAHEKVACKGCHPPQPQSEKIRARSLPPKSRAFFVRYKGIEAKRCTDCHRDVHAGKFGAECSSCHGQVAWSTTLMARDDRRFHQKTRYPLEGKHAKAPCASCHPTRGGKMKTRALAHRSCQACHFDAHFGQMPKHKGVTPCERCHTTEGFYPTRFPLADHQKGRFPLKGAHQAVACNACHPPDPARFKAKVPARARARKGRLAGNRLFNFTRIRSGASDEALKACETCHRDPHQGQFARPDADADADGAAGRSCTTCHSVERFSLRAFDHAKEARFVLDGAHAKAACSSCHPPDPALGGAARFRGTPRTCAACHGDPHGGQFEAGAGAEGSCRRCHDTVRFKPSRFDHRGEGQALFALTGPHEKVACKGCHPVSGAGDAARDAVWYRGVPRRCDGCHQDLHPGLDRQAVPGLSAPAKGAIDCSGCHAGRSWPEVSYGAAEHAATGFALEEGHARLACDACHLDLTRLARSARCESCHRDPHGGRLGTRCERCHETTRFEAGAGVLAHGQSRLPLVGRHAMVPCEQCHRMRADARFAQVPIVCSDCHARDAARTAGTAVDHTLGDLSPACEVCHGFASWGRASLAGHDRCFPITRGRHAGYRCADCHRSPAGLEVGSCTSGTSTCVSCHPCDRMDRKHLEEGLASYRCADDACYSCHPDGRSED